MRGDVGRWGRLKRLPRSADPRLRQQKLPTKLLLLVLTANCEPARLRHESSLWPLCSDIIAATPDLVINLICLSNINFPVTYFIHLSSRSHRRSHSKSAEKSTRSDVFALFLCSSAFGLPRFSPFVLPPPSAGSCELAEFMFLLSALQSERGVLNNIKMKGIMCREKYAPRNECLRSD